MSIIPIIIIVVSLSACFVYIGYKIGWDKGLEEGDKWADYYFKLWQQGKEDDE